jgi:hypothetical protein
VEYILLHARGQIMRKYQVSPDDVQDVREMTKKLQKCICEIIKGNTKNLGLSALMNASVNLILYQCDDKEEAIYYRDAFFQLFDGAIEEAMSEGD